MHRAVALLRGINVGGHRVAMADLRRHFEALGLAHVATFIASGNVIFDLPAGNPAALERRIEKHLEKALGFAVPTYIRTVDELREAVDAVPFPKVLATDSLYVNFLRTEPDEAARRAILALVHRFAGGFHQRARLAEQLRRVLFRPGAFRRADRLARVAHLLQGHARAAAQQWSGAERHQQERQCESADELHDEVRRCDDRNNCTLYRQGSRT